MCIGYYAHTRWMYTHSGLAFALSKCPRAQPGTGTSFSILRSTSVCHIMVAIRHTSWQCNVVLQVTRCFANPMTMVHDICAYVYIHIYICMYGCVYINHGRLLAHWMYLLAASGRRRPLVRLLSPRRKRQCGVPHADVEGLGMAWAVRILMHAAIRNMSDRLGVVC